MMIWSTSTTRTSVLGLATRIAVIIFIFGLAECAAGSCLSYGHSCWGAHGKRSGNSAKPDELPVPEDSNDGIPSTDDTRWFLSKLVRQGDSGIRNNLWQRLNFAHTPDIRHRDQLQWKSNPIEEDAENTAIIRENDDMLRSRGVRIEGSDESSGIFMPASGEYPEENQDGEIVFMSDDQPIRRVPKKLRVFKIMNHPGRKLDK